VDDPNNLDEPCRALVGFLFKRRCGRLSRVGCAYCNGVALDSETNLWDPVRDPFFTDRMLYPDFQNYTWWTSDNPTAVDFVDADGATLLNDDDDFDFEKDLEAS